jgi:hypothetical protein
MLMSEAAQAWCVQARTMLDLRRPPDAQAEDANVAPTASGGRPVDTAAFYALWQAAREAWNTASETVDGQIAALQAALLKSKDPELQLIGELGLNAVTGNFKVPLLAAMQSLSNAPPEARAPVVASTRQAINGFRQYLGSSQEVAVVDDNPLDVPVRIVATLVPALDTLEKSLDAAGV